MNSKNNGNKIKSAMVLIMLVMCVLGDIMIISCYMSIKQPVTSIIAIIVSCYILINVGIHLEKNAVIITKYPKLSVIITVISIIIDVVYIVNMYTLFSFSILLCVFIALSQLLAYFTIIYYIRTEMDRIIRAINKLYK